MRDIMAVCAIHQPNFFPWAGYFDKIRKADVFIFLDEVAYPKSGSGAGSWCNRVKLLNAGTPFWVGIPICREAGEQAIKNVSFSNKEFNIKKILRFLEYNYKKTPSYPELITIIEPLLHYPVNNLAAFNINAITQLSNFLGLKTKFVKQSELYHQKHSTELLIELTKAVGADTYISGNGSLGYQEDHLFSEAGIKLVYQCQNPAQNFVKNLKKEEEGLSILHLLFGYCSELNKENYESV
jgi:hypothetical protein